MYLQSHSLLFRVPFLFPRPATFFRWVADLSSDGGGPKFKRSIVVSFLSSFLVLPLVLRVSSKPMLIHHLILLDSFLAIPAPLLRRESAVWLKSITYSDTFEFKWVYPLCFYLFCIVRVVWARIKFGFRILEFETSIKFIYECSITKS